ncbi:MAG: hypothetical protein OXH09_05065 [Gammaproteobacteria bacterium]|nr:hypothetical protein [Gammaproteobacteria bacterium]
MGLKHLQGAAWAACLAAGLAVLDAGAQEGGPPGSEPPGEMEGKVETIIVIGDVVRCHDGTLVGDISACPAYVSFPNRFFTAYGDEVSKIIRNFHSAAQTCGRTPDANCVCATGKVKVYDDNDDSFHCKNDPPTSCPNWDDKFNWEPRVWKCEERELDANALDAVNRIKGCFGSGSTIHKFWSNVQRFEYGTDCPGDALACVISCSNGGANNVIQFDKAELAKARLDNSGQPIDATVWQWLNEATNHEFRHVSHNVRFGCGPWNNPAFWSNVPVSIPRSALGEEIYTGIEAVKEYEAELGVKSPYHDQYKPANDKQLPYCRLW